MPSRRADGRYARPRCRTRSAPRSSRDPSTSCSTSSSSRRWSSGRSRCREIVDAYLAELDRMETSTSTSPPSSCSSRPRWWSSRPAACCPASTTLELDEELLRFEERDLLLARLLECKTFKDAAEALEARMRRADRSVPRTAGPEEPYRWMVPDPLERVKPDALARRRAAGDARGAAGRRSSTPTTSRPVRASVRDAVESVLRLLPASEADELPGPGGGCAAPPRGDRALPRRARALQAGHGRPPAVHQLR